MARQPAGSPVLEALLEQYEYDAIETCAADGSCMLACPVGIDTGKLVKQLRAARAFSARERGAGVRELAERSRARRGDARGRVLGDARRGRCRRAAPACATSGRDARRPAAPELPFTVREGAAAVYLPSCINRIFGSAPGTPARPSVP